MKKISELTPISGEIQEEDILVVNTAGGTRKITYAELCEAVKITLGIREVVESVNITEPGFLMDGQTASEALAQLNGNIEQLGSQSRFRVSYEPNPANWDDIGINHEIGIILSPIGYSGESSQTVVGFPTGAYAFGCLITFITYHVMTSGATSELYKNAQIYIPHNTGVENKIYIRTLRDINAGRKKWRMFTTSELINAVS